MKLAIFAASGATGRDARGHEVVAVARDPMRIDLSDNPSLQRAATSEHDPESVARALGHGATVLSTLGVVGHDKQGLLEAGVRALLTARTQRLVTLNGYDGGVSARATGLAMRTLLRSFMGAEIAYKAAADTTVLKAGGTVFHAGPLSNGPRSPNRRSVGLADVPRRFFPDYVSRAAVAAAMLDEVKSPQLVGQIAIPLER